MLKSLKEAELKAEKVDEELTEQREKRDRLEAEKEGRAQQKKFEEQLKAIQKKIQGMENAYDVCIEDLFNQTVKLEEMEKKAGNAEGNVSSLRSRLILLQGNAEKQEDRLAKSTLVLVLELIAASGKGLS